MRNTPLHIAARNGHYLICKYLIDNDANIGLKNKEDLTPEQYLRQIMPFDHYKCDALIAKQKTEADKKKLRDKFKSQTDTLKLLVDTKNTA